MLVHLTDKQYSLITHILEVMKPFYNNDFSSICKEVGTIYNATEEDIEKAQRIFSETKITAPVASMVNAIVFLRGKFVLDDNHVRLNELDEIKNPEVYTHSVELEKSECRRLITILDTYSRILMGQFFIIYEQLDIAEDNTGHELVERAFYDARWHGTGVSEARDLLIPPLKEMRLGWNGNFGISNSENAFNSKLSYELLKVLDKACNQSDSYVLKVTDEPLAKISGYNDIHSL